ncbi:hypothetical protein BDA96_02G296200 [Sorghum bicolor]|uniref:Secreted protein n=1 Tax=Sorghum bicolor TaxID=4558 RepID=A0A921RT58_SORBI|nr:hypothetical protein BDA96_02G296200 [Sorghum bicolor]
MGGWRLPLLHLYLLVVVLSQKKKLVADQYYRYKRRLEMAVRTESRSRGDIRYGNQQQQSLVTCMCIWMGKRNLHWWPSL